jgi:hypothetical protein
LCLDELDVLGNPTSTFLYGRDDISPYRRIEFVYLPCLTYKMMTLSEENRQKTECYAKEDDTP